MSEFLTFRKMVTPIFIQLLFWLGILGVIGAAIFLMTIGDQPVVGVLTLLLGPLVVRIYAELMIVVFRIHGSLNELVRVARDGGGSMPPVAAAGWPSSSGTTSHGQQGGQPAGGADGYHASPPPTSAGPSPAGPTPAGPPPSGPPTP